MRVDAASAGAMDCSRPSIWLTTGLTLARLSLAVRLAKSDDQSTIRDGVLAFLTT